MLRPLIRASHHSARLGNRGLRVRAQHLSESKLAANVDSRKALWVREYSDLCRSELEQQFLKRASAIVSELCDEYCGKTGRKNGEVFTSPVRSAFYREKLLLLFIELDAISEVYIFKREHDHAGGGCWGRTDYHDFADRPSRIIRNVDSRSLPALGEHVRLDVRLTPLGIFHR